MVFVGPAQSGKTSLIWRFLEAGGERVKLNGCGETVGLIILSLFFLLFSILFIYIF